MRAFTEHMGASCKDADLDNDPKTAEYGREEEKVTLYDDGVPELIGRKTVEKLFEGKSKENGFLSPEHRGTNVAERWTVSNSWGSLYNGI